VILHQIVAVVISSTNIENVHLPGKDMNPIRPASRIGSIFKKEEQRLLIENDMKNYKSIDSTTYQDGLHPVHGSVGSSSDQALQKLHKVDELEEADYQESQHSMEISKQKLMSKLDKFESPRGAVDFEVKMKCSVLSVEEGKTKCLKQKSNPLEGKLGRQLSLGTGFSKWNKENGNSPKVLARSGASFSGFSSNKSKEMMKDHNYSLFGTKSGNALLQARKMEEQERQDHNIQQSRVHLNLPAGRYFDALKGPELDVLKVSLNITSVAISSLKTITFLF
jgi:hypothetical protein